MTAAASAPTHVLVTDGADPGFKTIALDSPSAERDLLAEIKARDPQVTRVISVNMSIT